MADTQVAKREASPMTTLRDLLKKSESQIKMALPRHMSADRMLRVTLTAVQRTPELLKADPLSVVGSVVQASQLGLEPDGILGHAYLVPFNNRKTGRLECQLIAGYRGLIDLARRSGHVISIAAHIVYENDKFNFSYGLEDKLEHAPCMTSDRGKPVCAYAVARMREGGYAFDVMSIGDIEKIRQTSKAGNSGPWQTHWDEMARKTVVRRLIKYLPLSPELQKAVSLDEMADAGVAQSLDIEVEASEVVADATAQRQSKLREKYATATQNASEPSSADTGTSEQADALAPLRGDIGNLMSALDAARGPGSADKAFEQVCGDAMTLDELEEPKLHELEAFLRAALKPTAAAAANKQTERKTRPAPDALFGE